MRYKIIVLLLLSFSFITFFIKTPSVNAQQLVQTEIDQWGADAFVKNWNYYQGSRFALGYINKDVKLPPTPAWTGDISSSVHGSGVIANGVLYLPDEVSPGKIYALNITTGEKLWEKTVHSYPGQESLAHFNGKIFFADEGPATLYSINPSNGETFWTRTDLGYHISTSPIILNNTVIVGADDSSYSTLWGLNIQDGTTVWSFRLPYGLFEREMVGTKNNVYFLHYQSSYGQRLYNVDVKTGEIVWNTENIGDSSGVSFPTLLKDRIVVGSDKTFYAFNPVDGTKLWSYQVEGDISGGSAITQNGNIVVTWSHYPYPYDVRMTVLNQQGKKVIETTIETYGNQMAAPIVLKNVAFFSTYFGHLKAYDTLTGNLLWDSGAFDTGGASVTPMYYDGRMTVAGSNGHIRQWIIAE